MTQPPSRPQLVMSQRIGRMQIPAGDEEKPPSLSRLRGGGIDDDDQSVFSRYTTLESSPVPSSSRFANLPSISFPDAISKITSRKFLLPLVTVLSLLIGVSVYWSNSSNDRVRLENVQMTNHMTDDTFNDFTNQPTPFSPFNREFSNVVPIPTQLAISHNVPKIPGDTENLITVRTTTFKRDRDPIKDQTSAINIRYKVPAGTPTTAPWFDSQRQGTDGSPINVLWKFPAGTPTTAPWGQHQKDLEEAMLEGAESMPEDSSPTNIIWKYPAGTPTTAPWNDFISKASPTNIRWRVPQGTPTTAPWNEFVSDSAPTNIIWKFPANTPTTAPWGKLVSETSPVNIRMRYPQGTPTTAPWKASVEAGRNNNAWKGERKRHVELGQGGDDDYYASLGEPQNFGQTYAPTVSPTPQDQVDQEIEQPITLTEEEQEALLEGAEGFQEVGNAEDLELLPEEEEEEEEKGPTNVQLQFDDDLAVPEGEGEEEENGPTNVQLQLDDDLAVPEGEGEEEEEENGPTNVQLQFDDDLAVDGGLTIGQENINEPNVVDYQLTLEEEEEEVPHEEEEGSPVNVKFTLGEEEEEEEPEVETELEVDEPTVDLEVEEGAPEELILNIQEEAVDVEEGSGDEEMIDLLLTDDFTVVRETGNEKNRPVELPPPQETPAPAPAPTSPNVEEVPMAEVFEPNVETLDEIPVVENTHVTETTTNTNTNTESTSTSENVKVINNRVIEKIYVQGDAMPPDVNHHWTVNPNQGNAMPNTNVHVEGPNVQNANTFVANPGPNFGPNRYVQYPQVYTNNVATPGYVWNQNPNSGWVVPQVTADTYNMAGGQGIVQNGGAHYTVNGERIHYHMINGVWIPKISSGAVYNGPILDSPPLVETVDPNENSFSILNEQAINGDAVSTPTVTNPIVSDCDSTVDDSYLEDYHAPSGEDEAIYEIYYTNPVKTCGVIVEIGAKNGDYLSKSYFFEKALHWKPILIEANPTKFADLESNRPDAITISGGFCEGSEMTYVGNNHFKGEGSHQEVISELYSNTPVESNERDTEYFGTSIPCLSLRPVLADNGVTKIDVMYIATDGDALAVIRQMDWTVRVDIWVIELNGIHEDRDDVVRSVLKNNDYVKAEWDIQRWCNPQMMGHCMPNEVYLRKGFNPLPEDVNRRLMATRRRRASASGDSMNLRH